MFRRKNREDDVVDETADDEEVAVAEAAEPAGVTSPQGPWDLEDLPDDGVERLDLGALRIPVLPGLEVRVDVNPEHQVVAATLASPTSAMQIGVFAAPRSSGIWAEVRDEIAQSLRSAGGQAEDAQGPYGAELQALIPTDQPGQLAPARFLGVDAPRWFLRALVTGAAATDRSADTALIDALRLVAVDRGKEAMAVRDQLPLHIPREALEAAGQAGPEEQAPSLDPFERGPEITEVR